MPQPEPLPEGRLEMRRKQRIPTLKELVAHIAPENRYEEIPSGPARTERNPLESQFPTFRRDSRFSS